MKKLTLSFKIFLFLFISAFITLCAFYLYAFITPKIDINSVNQLVMYDKNGEPFYKNTPGAKWVSLEDISKHVIDATIATEDKNFFTHQGFDYLRILKAMYINIKESNISQGASTISQQYIKNLYLTFDKTWARKIEEAYLTFELEVHYDKNEILEGYLNSINYGAGNYGIENASLYYFNKSSKDLSLAEASILAGIPKNPTYYNPLTNYDYAKDRQYTVLLSMYNNNYISKETFDEVYNEEIVFADETKKNVLSSVNYYKDAVFQELQSIKQIPSSLIETGGLKIYTNLDVNIQNEIENIVKNELKNEENLEVATLVVEPSTGKIIALIGGSDYNVTQYNRVTQAERQVGSTMKPLLYYSALENGFTSSSTFSSEYTTFNLDNNKVYSPNNYGKKYANKRISLAAAIAFSDNIYAVKTHLFLGQNELVNVAKRMGINTPLEANASLALGTEEINMLDFSNAYSTLANYGIKNKNYLISKVTDINDNILYEYNYEEEQVLNRRYVYILNELLSNTYDYYYMDYTSPTMLSISGLLTNKYAVKSGSTDYDYWVVGYNKDALVMTWVGNDDNSFVNSSQSSVSKNIWAKSIETVLKEKETDWYEISEGVTASLVDGISGNLTNTGNNDILFYIKGTEPSINNDIFKNLFLQ